MIFTGHETKIMKNSIAAQAKMSSIEHMMNKHILIILLVQMILCLIGALLYIVANTPN